MSDLINRPPHYQAATGIKGECIEYTRQMPFAIGNSFKYVWRAGSKGDARQDLGKAVWYLTDHIENGPGWHGPVPIISDGTLKVTRRRYVLGCVARGDLERARQLIQALTDPTQLDEVI